MVRWDFSFLTRKKIVNDELLSKSKLSRVMGVLDVSSIGISATLGSGIYVLAGVVISKFAGPSIIFSFILAGIATFFSGLSYAELGPRVPRSGSAYVYIYVTMGEFLGFIMGWDLILEYIISTACLGNALSQYIDTLTGRQIHSFLLENLPMNLPGFGPYPDILAFVLIICVSSLAIIGVKESMMFNKILTLTNICILTFIIIIGATQANFDNWKIDTNDLQWVDVDNINQTCPESFRCGDGGFFPFGLDGIINGAAKCFYAFIGFDVIASTGEEVVNPKRNIPLSILITLIVVGILYCGLSSVLTLMIPYYFIDPDTPLAHAFEYVELDWAKYAVTIGAITSLTTCLYSGIFPMPRIIYSMANDGLIYKFLGKVMERFKTPYVATIFSCLGAAIMATIFDLNELVDMLSIGTLMAYTLVSICIIILRYRPDEYEKASIKDKSNSFNEILMMITKPKKSANSIAYQLVIFLTCLSVLSIIALCSVIKFVDNLNRWYTIAIIIVLSLLVLILSVLIWIQPQITSIKTFKVPLVPFFPFLSVLANTYMMMTLSAITWARFIIWFVIGIIVYYGYGIKNSEMNDQFENQMTCFPCIITKNVVLPKKDEFKLETVSGEVSGNKYQF